MNNDRELDFFNENEFYEAGALDSTLLQQQDQIQQTDQVNYRTSISYTEPLGNRTYLELTLSQRNYNNQVDQEVFDLLDDPNNGQTSLFNPRLSNAYESDYNYQQAGLNYRIVRNKVNYTLG